MIMMVRRPQRLQLGRASRILYRHNLESSRTTHWQYERDQFTLSRICAVQVGALYDLLLWSSLLISYVRVMVLLNNWSCNRFSICIDDYLWFDKVLLFTCNHCYEWVCNRFIITRIYFNLQENIYIIHFPLKRSAVISKPHNWLIYYCR